MAVVEHVETLDEGIEAAALGDIGKEEAVAIVTDLQKERVGLAAGADLERGAFSAGAGDVLHGVFDESLQGVGRDGPGAQIVGDVDGEAEAPAEAGLLDGEVICDELELVVERDGGALLGIERVAEEAGEALEHQLGASGIFPDEGEDGVDGVEEKVGLEAGLEGGEAGLGGEILGAFVEELLLLEFKGSAFAAVAEAFDEEGGDADEQGGMSKSARES